MFTLFGLLLLLTLDSGSDVVRITAIGGTVLGGALAVFFLLQHAGLFGILGHWIEGLANGAGWSTVVTDARALDAEIERIYQRRRALTASAVWRLLGWLAGTLEVWAALWVLGHPVNLGEALMLESLIQAVRSAAFLIPGALGVQEGGLILLGGLVGLTPETALALSLLKRVREVLWGIPGLAAWQLSHAQRMRRAPA